MNKIKKQLQNIPLICGVYFFKNAKGRIIYIGKAVNLKARVKSYFVKNYLYGIKTSMLSDIAKIDYKTTDTEIDALILESQLIKKYKPKYNVMLKDDKNYFYVVFTGDEFPKVFITHQPQGIKSLKSKIKSLGPYTDGAALKITLRYLRKIFPYCTCKNQHKLPCLKSHLGLCLGVCCAKSTDNSQQTAYNNNKKVYAKNIKLIIDILLGKRKNIIKKLKKEMKVVAKKEDFENAVKLRDKISALKNIFQHKISRDFRATDISGLKKLFGAKINRIEFYDISNISGQLATGSMAVFDGEKINKSEYRKFKIKTLSGSDDPAMMSEVLARRLKHMDWPIPNLIIVDGGITQLNAARKILKNTQVLCASLAKNPDRLFLSSIKQVALKDLNDNAKLLLQNLRDEAHRFAINYHRKLRIKEIKK